MFPLIIDFFLCCTTSGWSQCSGEELERVKRVWQEKQKEGKTAEFFEERKQVIQQIGETTTFVAHKGQ